MDAPQSFWKLCLHFIQDLPDLYPTLDGMLEFVVGGLLPDERRELAAFLDQILARPDASLHLARLWKQSQADLSIGPESRLADLFRQIRARL